MTKPPSTRSPNSAGTAETIRAKVHMRTGELARIAGRASQEVSQSDYEQAKRELTGESDPDRQQVILDARPESDPQPPEVLLASPESGSAAVAEFRSGSDGQRPDAPGSSDPAWVRGAAGGRTGSVGAASSELRYRRLFEAAHDGILIVDPDTRKIIDVNPFLQSFLGYRHEDFIGRELFEIGLLKDEAASQQAFRELQTARYIRYEDLPLETKDGRKVDVEFVSNVYQEGERQIIQCNVRDITERKKTENALRAAEAALARHVAELERVVDFRTEELRRSNAQLETFVYSIAHDLRAPLRAMQGFAQLLAEDHVADLNAQGQFYAQAIDRAAQTMDRMLADLLKISRISQQKIDLVPVSLEATVKAARAGVLASLGDRAAEIEMIGPWPDVLAHPGTLQQVLVNLIGNAVKFVETRTPHVRVRTESRPDGVARIWVEDNGIGIPVGSQPKIFQVFQRLHTNEYPGTGIGLAIVQKGVERMGGRVGVESIVGEGSRFWIDLAEAPAVPAGQAS